MSRVPTVQPSPWPDATEIVPRLWVGAAPDNLDSSVSRRQVDYLATRASLGLVIDCRWGADDRDLWAHRPEVEYVMLGVEDSGVPLPTEFFTTGVELVLEHRTVAQSSVLVHCESGAHRSPALALAVLLVDGVDLDVAVRQLTAARPAVRDRYFADAARWHRFYADL